MSAAPSENLGTDVLRDVSRSFYLTLRALPLGMREATSVGYLMARASDTIADCGGERVERLALLRQFQQVIAGGEAGEFFSKAAAIAQEDGLKEGERVLMPRLEEVFVWWQTLPEAEREAVREVVTTITTGQLWDLERFPEGEVVTLTDAAEAEEYCYRVAGCVGEFWTVIGFHNDPRFADRPKVEMLQLGRNYGKGLQLVNILRDEVEDEERGRRYLPGERKEWLEKARGYLEDGLSYSRAVRGRRARLATVLPALIGMETLTLLEKASREERAQGVKVNRKVVKRCLWRAFWFRGKK
ncbi:squalene/phytoene synthase family protein [Roseibacillus persicicus]|uniref:squalene/phytoene synthase family protein n=1 Tax=Roseibacillus persicicus TaxID=454148 RepID=UPI00280EB3E0|nr:squalene/phytoene synthase family protein [Roseibacillus persicicus]MDQ8191072.1 squalene/phytoene synthase family protein [Roseibacillus persicicus]